MSGFRDFIMHSNVADVLKALDNILTLEPITQKRGMLLLAGLPKTGKERIVTHWMQGLHLPQVKREQIELPRMLFVRDVWDPERTSFGSKVYVTPITCVLFTEMVYALGAMSIQLGSSSADRTWYRQPRSLYTDKQFTSLFAFVRSEVKRLRIPVLLINDAQRLDACALRMIMLLRKHCADRLGVVFIVRLQKDATLDEPLTEEFIRVPEARDICRRVAINQLTDKEYTNVVLVALMTELNLDVSADLLPYEHQIADLFWKATGSDWKLIDERLAQRLLRVLGSDRTRVRIITRAVLQEVLENPLPF